MSKPGEWIEWNGGECPVPPNTIVQAQGKGETRKEAEAWPSVEASLYDWSRTGKFYHDIIAYRVMKS